MTFKGIKNEDLEIIFSQNSYAFRGKINEAFDPNWASEFGEDEIIMDFENLILMNSAGVLKFINFTKKLRPEQKIQYQNVPAVVVSQMSIVKGLITKDYRIETFYVPYISKESDEQIMIKLSLQDVANGKIPTRSHPVSRAMIEHDVNEDKFLNFLKF